MAVGEDMLDTQVAYMDVPAAALAEMDANVSMVDDTHKQSQAEQKNREEATKREDKLKKDIKDALTNLKSNTEAFGKPSLNLTQLSTERRIGFVDMRLEMTKLKESYSKLLEDKTKVLRLNSGIDLTQDEEN